MSFDIKILSIYNSKDTVVTKKNGSSTETLSAVILGVDSINRIRVGVEFILVVVCFAFVLVYHDMFSVSVLGVDSINRIGVGVECILVVVCFAFVLVVDSINRIGLVVEYNSIVIWLAFVLLV